jgi:nucleoside-diphosphate kinase
MKGRLTFTIIKPDAFSKQYTGKILEMIYNNGFNIAALKLIRMSSQQAEDFYAVHKGKSFYEGLVKFMTSGPVIIAILEKENAVEEYRKLIGATDPARASDGTIRKLFARSVQENAIIECNFFFSESERYHIAK